MTFVVLAMVSALPACVATATEEDPVDVSLDELKVDSFYAPTHMGVISQDDWSQATLTTGSRYHLWTFTLGDAFNGVQLWTREVDGHQTDTVMYLYQRQASGRWGRHIAKNDDGHWSFADEVASYDEDLAPFSYLQEKLDAGEYGVLVKGKRSSTRGPYHVTYDCSGQSCP